ncbi:hypothetical protein [Streptomyces sp. NBC_00878]|uniref:hypothetical protein n=1 Tax=Streptomyces sp. NBC_00878 TaxID=2975854 RepID=UPI0022551D4E|nr:hypothetical protein [Streptomyces sp. NBC_00878]MCX4910953.1 hypothetical protein [Streptomyces sp. NBC_00878]
MDGDVRGVAAAHGPRLTAAAGLGVEVDRGERGRDQGALLGVVVPDDRHVIGTTTPGS